MARAWEELEAELRVIERLTESAQSHIGSALKSGTSYQALQHAKNARSRLRAAVEILHVIEMDS